MNTATGYLEKNRITWNARTEVHIGSDFYDLDNFLKGHTSLKEIELPLLTDIAGKSVLHLQCHFGQDTLSLARLGARVTGVDLSDKAIAKAQELALQIGQEATFMCCDVYDLPQQLSQQFDVVFASYGTIGWLPDLDKWAAVVAHFLKPGGRLVFAEFHPVLELFDDNYTQITYSYFNTGPMEMSEQGTYADREAAITYDYVWWNHPVSEIITSLLNQGLELTSFQEYDYSPYNCFRHLEEFAPGRFRIAHMGNKLPMVYSLTAAKNCKP